MSRMSPSTFLPAAEPVAVVCAATYYADLRREHAFTFRVAQTGTRFTIYAARADSYQVGGDYTLVVAAGEGMLVRLEVEDVEFLRHCLHNCAHRWREAIAEADAGASRPRREPVAEPGAVDAEPTPAGYRTVSRLLRDELAHVERLGAVLDEDLHAQAHGNGDRS